jgi:hypothetical protein
VSWFLKRAQALARQGWRDDFTRADESPIKQPWRPWGSSVTADLVGNRMRINDADWFQTGGIGFEHQPLTPNWGIEFRTEFASYSGGDSGIKLSISNNWPQGGASKRYIPVISMAKDTDSEDPTTHRITLYRKDTESFLNLGTVADIYSFSSVEWAMPHNWRIRCFNDKTFAIWMDDIVRIVYTYSDSDAAYRPGPGTRGVNFQRIGSSIDCFIDNFAIYDMLVPLPTADQWVSQFYDDFNRTNNTTIGNGWTKVGANAAISSNAYATTGTTDGSRGIYQSTPLSSGNMRLETVWGGPNNVTVFQCSSLIGRMNSAGSLGIAANFFSDKIYIAKMTGSLSSPTFVDLAVSKSLPANVANGAKYALCIYGDEAWVEDAAGNFLVFADGINAASPDTNRYFGARVQRGAFINSQSFNDYRALTA